MRMFVLAALSFLSAFSSADGQKYSVLSGSHAVCSASRDYLNNWRDHGFEISALGIEKMENSKRNGSFSLPHPLIGVPVEDYDFNNDGKTDSVFWYENSGSYISGTILYVVFGDKKPSLNEAGVIDLSELKIFPCQFDKTVVSSAGCPILSQDNDDAGIDVSLSNGKIVHFRARYTWMTPIRFKGGTYLILQSLSKDTEQYGAVIRPSEATNYSSVCLLVMTQ